MRWFLLIATQLPIFLFHLLDIFEYLIRLPKAWAALSGVEKLTTPTSCKERISSSQIPSGAETQVRIGFFLLSLPNSSISILVKCLLIEAYTMQNIIASIFSSDKTNWIIPLIASALYQAGPKSTGFVRIVRGGRSSFICLWVSSEKGANTSSSLSQKSDATIAKPACPDKTATWFPLGSGHRANIFAASNSSSELSTVNMPACLKAPW